VEPLSHSLLQWDIILYALSKPASPPSELEADGMDPEAEMDLRVEQDRTLEVLEVLEDFEDLDLEAPPASLGPFTSDQVCLLRYRMLDGCDI